MDESHEHEWKVIWQEGDGPVVVGCDCGLTKGYTQVQSSVVFQGALIITDGQKIVKHDSGGVQDITDHFG